MNYHVVRGDTIEPGLRGWVVVDSERGKPAQLMVKGGAESIYAHATYGAAQTKASELTALAQRKPRKHARNVGRQWAIRNGETRRDPYAPDPDGRDFDNLGESHDY